MQAVRCVVADRHDALTGQTNMYTQSNVSQLKNVADNGEGPHPELMLALLRRREEVKPTEDMGCVRGLLADLRSACATLRAQVARQSSARSRAELGLAENLLANAQKIWTEQTRINSELEKYDPT